MSAKPAYFERVRNQASGRWDQLERDPDLAGPWHQLFKQVQSPRHILSELLQNADDAGATEASVRIEDKTFIFGHNGEDFREEHFESLCRFGYSNKRALHTIGFRGIGFKSTFSLGDTVELFSPTLAVVFTKNRFTEPNWVDTSCSNDGTTFIRVAIGDDHRLREVEKNLKEWLKSPVSLLFFKNIRKLQITDQNVHWQSLGQGPVEQTEWMALDGNADSLFLIAKSETEPFPSDALAEIKQERLLGADQSADFPPCNVEIVLGATGRFYVVLPTGVETTLPFASNAPFIQDPARVKIKDPETSPTNRWLLERIGALAAKVMVQWLGQSTLSLEERSKAYGLFPKVVRDADTLECVCGSLVEDAFDSALREKPFLLTHGGELRVDGESIVIPEELFDVWPAEVIAPLLDESKRPIFSRHVSVGDRQKLVARTDLENKTKSEVLRLLQTRSLPTPETWRALLNLWVYIAPELTTYNFYNNNKQQYRILPVHGKEELYSADQVVRLSEKKLLQTDSDWEFLSAHLLVLNPNWTRYLADQRRAAGESNSEQLKRQIDAGLSVLHNINLVEASDVSTIIDRVAAEFFNQAAPIEHCVQLTQIAAKLNVAAGEKFRFMTQDGVMRPSKHVVLSDADGSLKELLPAQWNVEHVLHQAYTQSLTSCTTEEWRRWIDSGRSGLFTFVPLIQLRKPFDRDWQSQRNFKGFVLPPYKTNKFVIEDWDYPSEIWNHWHTLARSDRIFWGRLFERILALPEVYWLKCQHARVLQIATTGSEKPITDDPVSAWWIAWFRIVFCLPDTRGSYCKPGEIFRRTPETESLLDVETFIHGRLDTEALRPLLKHLGVVDTPSKPDRLLDRLRALSKSSTPPVQEVDKWYRRLDQLSSTCSTADLYAIRKAVHDEKLILTENCTWTTASFVFLSLNEDDAPGAELIRASVRDLALWRKVDVGERPTADLAIKWLNELPKGKALDAEDARRVRALMARHALRIWTECNHWINLAGEWVPGDSLEYALSAHSLIPWPNLLFLSVKRQTADFRPLPVELTQVTPFAALRTLANHIEERFQRNLLLDNSPERHPWLNQVGIELRRIQLDNEAETIRIRTLGTQLVGTMWQVMPGMEIVPYIDGTPAGTPRRADVVWLDQVLYIDDLPIAKLARVVPDRLGNLFNRIDVTAALNYCFERSPQEVSAYFEMNFTLVPRDGIELCAKDNPAPNDHKSMENGVASSALPADASVDPALSDASDDAPILPQLPSESANGHGPVVHPELPELDHGMYKMRPLPKPAKPDIIESFARSKGFRKDGDERFCHADGSQIARAYGSPFPWERRTANGEVVRYYWPKEHCLELEPLQLESEVWGLIDKFPGLYALVLASPEDDAVEVSGTRLLEMLNGGNLNLFPATYRLVHGGGG